MIATGTPAAPLRALVEELVHAGVTDAVICPGSRSTPLALALRASDALRCWVHIDERVGGFFALGLAKAQRRAVAVLTTSGTAAVNLAPAVVEARQGRVPLVVLTADRPAELRDRGAAQTIDQDRLYGRHAKWYAEVPLPDDRPDTVARVRGLVARAVATAMAAPAGPVQLDAPFREPLLPDGPLGTEADGRGATLGSERPYVGIRQGVRALPARELEALAQRVGAARRGLIVCGPMDVPGFAAAVTDLAASSGFPLLADGLSNLRCGTHDRSAVVAHHDGLLRSPGFSEAHRPDLVLRFGGTPTSTILLQAVLSAPVEQIVVDDGGWNEPTGMPVTMVAAEPVTLATSLATAVRGRTRAVEPGWSDSWLAADAAAAQAVRSWLDRLEEPFEGAVFAALPGALPEGGTLLAGNSMPVRDLEAFGPSSPGRLRFIGNRGANGIDGLVATALGAAAAGQGPVVAVVGDLSFLHDLGALVAARRLRLDLTVVLVDNDGGGIFSFLPQAAADRPDLGLPGRFEELFATPHGLDLGPLAEALGAQHRRVGHADLGTALGEAVRAGGLQVLHLRTDRARNVVLHRDAVAAVHEGVKGLG